MPKRRVKSNHLFVEYPNLSLIRSHSSSTSRLMASSSSRPSTMGMLEQSESREISSSDWEEWSFARSACFVLLGFLLFSIALAPRAAACLRLERAEGFFSNCCSSSCNFETGNLRRWPWFRLVLFLFGGPVHSSSDDSTACFLVPRGRALTVTGLADFLTWAARFGRTDDFVDFVVLYAGNNSSTEDDDEESPW